MSASDKYGRAHNISERARKFERRPGSIWQRAYQAVRRHKLQQEADRDACQFRHGSRGRRSQRSTTAKPREGTGAWEWQKSR